MSELVPNVTVIVPVYNVESYIERCARSIFEQTINYLEIIFVDDCSPDNSINIVKNILEEYPKRKSLTRFIYLKENSGSAYARRLGIINSKGKYVIHCDGDDWIDKDLYESMFNKAELYQADIVICDEVYEYVKKSIPMHKKVLPTDGKIIIQNFYKDTLGLHCHNKLVNRHLYIDNAILPWDGLNMWEDNGLFARLFYFAKQVHQVHGSRYHYNRMNVNAMTSIYKYPQIKQMVEIAKNLSDFFESKPDSISFEKTVNAFKFLAKINLITDSFKLYNEYKNTFVGAEKIMSELDRNAFSRKGQFRFNMVRFGLAKIFIIMFKFRNMFIKYITK